MAWCFIPPVYRSVWSTPYSPQATTAAFRAASVPWTRQQNVDLWSSRQPVVVPTTQIVRLMCYRRSVDTCGRYALGGSATGSVGAKSEEHAAIFHRVHPPKSVFLGWVVRCFGTQRVVQKRRHQMRILHPLQTPYVHHPGGTPPPIPHSLTATGTIKRLLNCNSAAAKAAASRINWEAYISHKKGVRWHPQGAWRVQFTRKNHERNFFVRCECYFKVSDYGFETAKELAIKYRERLEKEWEELQQQWNRLDIEEARARMRSKTGVEIETQRLVLPHSTTAGETPTTNTSKNWSADGK